MAGPLPAQFYPCKLYVPCETFNCRNRAAWSIGRPDAPVSTNYYVCDKCARSIVELLPDELKPQEPEKPEATELPEAVKELLNSKGHKCQECGKMFDTEQGLIIHMTKVHKE